MTEPVKEPWTIWTPLGGMKRGMALISLVVLVAAGTGLFPLSETLQQIFMTLALGATAGNTAQHLKEGK